MGYQLCKRRERKKKGFPRYKWTNGVKEVLYPYNTNFHCYRITKENLPSIRTLDCLSQFRNPPPTLKSEENETGVNSTRTVVNGNGSSVIFSSYFHLPLVLSLIYNFLIGIIYKNPMSNIMCKLKE